MSVISAEEYSLPSGQTHEHAAYLRWLLRLLPPDICGFCETHSMSPELVVNLPIAKVESANDVAGEVSCFFRAARERGDEFGECLMTPMMSCDDEELERARAFFQLAVWGRFEGSGRARGKSWSDLFPHKFMPEQSRFEREWAPRIPHLREVICRLKMFAFDARPANEILKIYARPNILRLIAPRCLADLKEESISGINGIGFDTPGEFLLIVPSFVQASGLIGKTDNGWFRDDNADLSLFAIGNYDRTGLAPSLLSVLA